MPFYEYLCTNAACGHELETLQKISDDPLVYCPSCGESSLKKKISAAGFRLKGSGWYETDFKNSGKKTAAKESSKESPKDSATDSATDSAKSSSGESKSTSGEGSGKSESKPAGGGSTEAA